MGDQLGELGERHLADVVEGEQIARLVVEVVERPAQQGQHRALVRLVDGGGAGIGTLRLVPSQHLEPVPGAAPVAGGDAAADLAQPQVHSPDLGDHGPLAVDDEEDLLTEVGEIRPRTPSSESRRRTNGAKCAYVEVGVIIALSLSTRAPSERSRPGARHS